MAVLIGLGCGALAIVLTGGDPIRAYGALAGGAFGSVNGWSEVAVKTCPLLLTGLAIAIAFRAGIWNIGAEGQLVAGAIAAVWLGTQPLALPWWLGVLAVLAVAAVAGGLVSGIAASLRLWRNVDVVISTIMLNFIVLGLLGWLVHGPLMESTGQYPQTDAVLDAARIPRPLQGYRLHLGIAIALALVPLTHALLFATPLGFAMRAVGANPRAARIAGLPVAQSSIAAFLISGALAGVAGGIEVGAITYRLYENFSPGYGYTAIAVALLGRLDPRGVVAAAFLFGALDAGSSSMQRVAGVSSVLVSFIQACVILALAAVEYRTRFAHEVRT